MDLKGQVAFVTGGTRGIGKAIAEAFARKGVHVAVAGRNQEKAAEVAGSLSSLGIQSAGIKLDVSNADDVKRAFDEILKIFGRLDILINNAGITKDGLLLRMKEDDWDAVMNTNLRGVFLCSKTAIREMLSRRYGRIVNITSVAGFMGNPGQANYSAAKAGIVGFTKTAAREYAGKGITVNAVAPGFITTAMTDALPENVREEARKLIPLGRFGTVEDIAHAVTFLSLPESGYITGQVIHVNGGMYM
jgi:3-oxoacyl-[acyl-carrier protein] reductase